MSTIQPLKLPSYEIDSRQHAGFDYKRAILELRKHHLSYEEIGYFMGYRGNKKTSVARIVNGGGIPSHDKGEMLWALYCRVFGEKPPRSETQKAGLEDNAFLDRIIERSRKRSTLKRPPHKG